VILWQKRKSVSVGAKSSSYRLITVRGASVWKSVKTAEVIGMMRHNCADIVGN